MTLNPAQREAVEARGQDILTLACAGAGKTRTLIERIAHAIETDTPAWSILAVTFTNKAADEMRERLAKRVGEANARQVWMGTFHALGARLLHAFCAVAGFPDGFSIYDDADCVDVCLLVAHEMGLAIKAKEPSIEGIHGIATRAGKRKQFDVLYQATLRRYAATDYDGLETHLLALLQSPAVRTYVQRFREIMVDEYQDTNGVQERILEAFRGAVPGLRIFKVGDPSQSIYGFRGARMQNILDAAETPGMRVIRLNTNYRSGRAIVEAGNRIAAHTGSPLGRVEAGPYAAQGGATFTTWGDSDERSVGIARCIENHIAESDRHKPGDFMVLCRNWKPLFRVEAELKAIGIPCDLPKREADAWSSPAMRWLVAAMRLTRNPRDGIALRRVLRWPAPAASEAQIQRAEARSSSGALAEFLKDGTAVKRLGSLGTDLTTGTASDFARAMESDSDWWLAAPDGVSDSLNAEMDGALARIAAWTERRQTEGKDDDIKAFLAWWSFRDVRDAEAPAAEDGGKVRLLTIHAAKGLEAPVVHSVGPDLGVFPKHGDDARGEELRLWYVAVTRARDVFVAHTAAEVEGFCGQLVPAGPSPFVEYLREPELLAPAVDFSVEPSLDVAMQPGLLPGIPDRIPGGAITAQEWADELRSMLPRGGRHERWMEDGDED